MMRIVTLQLSLLGSVWNLVLLMLSCSRMHQNVACTPRNGQPRHVQASRLACRYRNERHTTARNSSSSSSLLPQLFPAPLQFGSFGPLLPLFDPVLHHD